jgi:hypothetical protein
MSEPIEAMYFNWLCAKVQYIENPTPSLTHWKLLNDLYRTEYVWLLSGDDNRAADGMDLRMEFLRSSPRLTGHELDHLGCSLLEFFIAFSRRAEFQTSDSINAKEWFWRFMKTLHLDEFNDANYDEDKVDDILYTFVWREYKYSGKGGGLFPLNHPKRDQRQLEIWYQFCDYVWEKDIV